MGLSGAWLIAARSVAVFFRRRKVGVEDCGFDVLQDGDFVFRKEGCSCWTGIRQGTGSSVAPEMHACLSRLYRAVLKTSRIRKVAKMTKVSR
jgi:hypothetical protein